MAAGELLAYDPVEAGGILATGFTAGVAATWAYMRSPFHDEGFSVYGTPDIKALQTVISVCEANGLEPKKEITDEDVIRALMSDGRTVFNTVNPQAPERIRDLHAVPMLRVKDPKKSAEGAAQVFSDEGFAAEVTQLRVKRPQRKMFFVATDALLAGGMGFRTHVINLGDRPPKWDSSKSLVFAEPPEAAAA